MVFNSIAFLVFFVIFYALYQRFNKKANIKIRNLFILVASYVFYGWWDWRFLSLIFISSIADYLCGLRIHSGKTKRTKTVFLIISIAVNLGMLCFFKYYNFFVESLVDMLSMFSVNINTATLSIILPVGISFYTFQTLSYTIDIYRDKLKPTKDIISFFTFVAFFPQLVAGPIERAKNLLPQFFTKRACNYDDTITGLRTVLYGLFKKVVIADNLGAIVDILFDPALHTSSLTIFIASCMFTLQIYCDFSGYSDIAIGISGMLGFKLKDNFKTPFFSGSFTEFWHRWHISLSSWFRDYVYIPLGGSRKSSFRTNLNIFLTFTLSGLWHGAKFTFLIWGALHGIVLIIEKSIKFRVNRRLAIPFVFIIVALLFMPFRTVSVDHFLSMTSELFSFTASITELTEYIFNYYPLTKTITFAVVLVLFILVERIIGTNDFNSIIRKRHFIIRYLAYYSLALAILFLSNLNVKPFFIYFQF